MAEYDDKQAYLEIFNREAARYSVTPARYLIQRHRTRNRLRSAYADAMGVGNQISMPLTRFQSAMEWTGNALTDSDFWLSIFAIAIVAIIIWLVAFVGIFASSSPKPLPPGIQQRGYMYTIPANYARRANYKDMHADDLCGRLPQWDSRYDDAHAYNGPNGSIVIRCDR